MAVATTPYSQDGINAGWIRNLDSSGDPTGNYLELKGFNAANLNREVTTRTLLSNNTTYKETSKVQKYSGTVTLVALRADMLEYFLPGALVIDGTVATFTETVSGQPTKFAMYLKSDADGESGEAGAIGEFYYDCQVTNFTNPKVTGEYVSFEATITALAKSGNIRQMIFDSSSVVFNTSGDSTAPTVSSVTASAGTWSGSVATTANIVITFSESMKEADLANIKIYAKSTGALVAYAGTYDNGDPYTWTMNPTSDFSSATDYVVHIPDTIRDANGVYLAAPEFHDFTTA